MERTIISFDYAIKEILRDKANFDILSGFLTELVGRQVVVQEIIESEGNRHDKDGKTNRLDLKARMDGGEIAVFEIQFADQIDFLGKVLFNACRAVVEQVSAGQLYNIKKVYSINIAYFDMGARNDYIFTASLNEFKGAHFGEAIPFSQHLDPLPSATKGIHPEYFLILPDKFDGQMRGRFDEWVYVLKNSSVRSDFTAAGVQAAGERLDVMKMTPEERTRYAKDKSDALNIKTQFYTAELKGEVRGEKNEKIATVTRMIKKGKSLEDISEATDLSIEQIKEIIKNR